MILVAMKICKIIVLCFVGLCYSDEENPQKVLDVPEGSYCMWNGLDGKCTNILKCRSSEDSIRRKIYPPICSFQDKTPIVCCTDSEQGQSTTTPIKEFELDSRFNRTGSKARDNCLKYQKKFHYPCTFRRRNLYEEKKRLMRNSSDYVDPTVLDDVDSKKPLDSQISSTESYTPTESHENQYFHYPFYVPPISAGVDAWRNQYPHMALLGYGHDTETAQWLCGGSVISEKFILTAAHCISSPTVGPVKFVALGIHKRTDPPAYWQIYNLKRVIPHPEYRPPSKYNDIALLETEEVISFGPRVLPACLHFLPESDETAVATGWGALGHHQGLADTLQTVKLQRYDKEKCSQLYPKHRHLREGYNHSSQMCYGDTQTAKDTCEGDSGGPLQTVNEYPSCAYTVLGVTSYGRQCGISAGSGMYTRVYHYVPWIESIAWP